MKKITMREITMQGLMLAMISALSMLEARMLPLPFHMRCGLSNVVTMYALFFIGGRSAFTLAVLKSIAVLIMRGPVAGLLSFSGGMASLCVIASIAAVWKNASYFLLSEAGAVTHNIAQIAAASWLTSSNLWLFLTPVMTVAGLAAGGLTSALLRAAMPFLTPAGRLPGGTARRSLHDARAPQGGSAA